MTWSPSPSRRLVYAGGLWLPPLGSTPGGGGVPGVVDATIVGPSTVTAGQQATWTVSLAGGVSPLSVAWTVDGAPAGSTSALSVSLAAGVRTIAVSGSAPGAATYGASRQVQAVATGSGTPAPPTDLAGGEWNPYGPLFAHGIDALSVPGGVSQAAGLARLGIDPDADLTPVSGFSTSAAGQVVTELDIRGICDVNHANVIFYRCRIWRQGTLYGVRYGANGRAIFVDCDIVAEPSGTSVPSAAIGPGTTGLIRCDIGPSTLDGWKFRSDCWAVDSVFREIIRVPGGHHDFLQTANSLAENGGLLRCCFVGTNSTGGNVNASWQLGSWGETWQTKGMRNIHVRDCYFSGGNGAVGGDLTGAGIQGPVYWSGNIIGASQNGDPPNMFVKSTLGHVITADNTYETSGLPVDEVNA